jgi:hypothetical protein
VPTAEEVIQAYGDSWNEPDESKRRQLIERSWADGGVFQDPRDRAVGQEALLALIAGFREAFPGAAIVPTSGLDVHHEMFRFTWRIDDKDGAPVLEGFDYGELADDGRISVISGFWGPLPAAPQ